MATISSYDSNSISTLFSSLNNQANSATFGMSSLDYGTYYSIRNGSYGKLVKAYYDKNLDGSSNKTDSTTNNKKNNTVNSDQKVNAATVKNSASSLVKAQKELDAESLWKKKTTTDNDGNTNTDYDRDAIYKAVSAFAENYNSLVSSTAGSADNSVLRSGSTMVAYTNANKSLLSSVGITVDSNNKLKVDETKLKNSDMSTVKSLFDGSGSYGKTVASSASSAYSSAVSQLAKLSSAGTYSDSGSYSYSSEAIYDRFL